MRIASGVSCVIAANASSKSLGSRTPSGWTITPWTCTSRRANVMTLRSSSLTCSTALRSEQRPDCSHQIARTFDQRGAVDDQTGVISAKSGIERSCVTDWLYTPRESPDGGGGHHLQSCASHRRTKPFLCAAFFSI